MKKYANYKAVCLNGTIQAGDEIMTTPMTDYPTMRGHVLCIHPEGSPEQAEESCNEGCDDVHVELYTDDLPPARIKEIEDIFSDLYDEPKSIDDIPLDDEIESNAVLLNINGISERDKNRIDQSERLAQQVAFEILAEFAFNKANKYMKPDLPLGMHRITVKEFAERAVHLSSGAAINFFVTNEDGETLEHSIISVQLIDSNCLVANSKGGGRPMSIDITTYCSDLQDISEALDKYVNDGSGSFGYVNVIVERQCAQEESASSPGDSERHMLISVIERDISTAIFPTHEQAYAQMERELDKTMDGDRCEYEDEYEIDEDSAWSNADNNANADWLIVKI